MAHDFQNTRSKVEEQGKAKTEERGISLLSSFWSSLLQSSSEEAGLPREASSGLSNYVTKRLNEQFDGDFGADVRESLALDDHALDDRIASEKRALNRDQRRTRRKQGLLEEEEARLEAFRPARKANEQDEASEIAAKLHPLAEQFLSKKPTSDKSMSSKSLQDLQSAKRKLESLEEGLSGYEPEDDDFLGDLTRRLKPPKLKKPKT